MNQQHMYSISMFCSCIHSAEIRLIFTAHVCIFTNAYLPMHIYQCIFTNSYFRYYVKLLQHPGFSNNYQVEDAYSTQQKNAYVYVQHTTKICMNLTHNLKCFHDTLVEHITQIIDCLGWVKTDEFRKCFSDLIWLAFLAYNLY